MDRFTLSTEHLPERDQFAFWREECMEGVVGTTVEGPDRANFSGRLSVLVSQTAVRVQMQSDGFAAPRTARQIARIAWQDWMCVYVHDGARMLHQQPGREDQDRAQGDVLIFDPTLPLFSRSDAAIHSDIWLFPRKLIEPHISAGTGPIWRGLSGEAAANPLIKAYLAALGEHMGQLADAELAAVIDNFCRLLAIGCGAVAGEQREAIKAAQLEQIKRHINLHLAKPDLTAAGVAAAHRISVRRLHLLFEPTGTSFMQHVVSRRLEEVHASLISPASAGRSVTDVALGWGFNSLPTFYRAFARRYELTPGDLRAASRSGRAEPRGPSQ